MGVASLDTFTVPVQVGDSNGRAFVDIQALVDTGSTYTSIPVDILSGLGVEVIERHPFGLADESIVEYGIGEAKIRLDGRERTVVVVFMPDNSSPLLGATTLEIFGLGVDPVGMRLAPVPMLLK
jgi:aspartyl protease family protein